MKKIMIIAAALAAMTACNKSVLETATPSEGFGYINLGISADAEMVVTKAESAALTAEQLANYTVTLKQGETQKWSKKYSEINSETDWKVTAGEYTVVVENLTTTAAYDNSSNDNANGKLRLAGSSSVTVVAGKTATCSVKCTAANAKVTFITDDNFNTAFTNPSVSVSQSLGETTRTVSMGTPGSSHTEENLTAAFFEGGTAKWTLTATLKGETGEKTYSKDITLTAGKWSQVTFSTTNTNGTISLTVTIDDAMTSESVSETIDPISTTTGSAK